ncbi:hypothetical protein UFOVP1360_12 [uncultured Caudovirales phage]|uniref:Uncharacterized protein n=1 Tax=uncultured Caudovirales phage TaxID=2100421 RepID=A0A6J5S1J8_9CAUD|nr:hypothetical protein UFOVP1360_12 [uncultured Caudovirales phage]
MGTRTTKIDNEQDGCEIDFSESPTPDADLDAVVLFADVDPTDEAAVAARAAEWSEVLS